MNNLFDITNFNINDIIQQKFLCKKHNGQNIFPNIFWKINNNKKLEIDFYTIIMEDPDAPSGTFVHWYIPYIPKKFNYISKENINEILVGYNTLGKKEYHGPCNPENKMHNYNFYLYGIKGDLDKQDNNMKKEFINTKSSNTYELLLKKNNLKIIFKKNKKFQYKIE